MKTAKVIVALTTLTLLAGCASTSNGPGYGAPPGAVAGIWLRKDGLSGRDNPALAEKFAVDKAACTQAFNSVDRACMDQRGYLLVPQDQVEQRAMELRAQSRSY